MLSFPEYQNMNIRIAIALVVIAHVDYIFSLAVLLQESLLCTPANFEMSEKSSNSSICTFTSPLKMVFCLPFPPSFLSYMGITNVVSS